MTIPYWANPFVNCPTCGKSMYYRYLANEHIDWLDVSKRKSMRCCYPSDERYYNEVGECIE